MDPIIDTVFGAVNRFANTSPDKIAVISGDAGVGADGYRSRGAARHHGRFGSHQGGQTIPDRFLKFLQDDILAGRFRLCLEKLGPLLGSSNRRVRPLKVDERPQAEFFVNGLFRPRGRG